MIISASRRTDIPAFYGKKFIEDLRKGFTHVKNPMNPRQISQISLANKDVDIIVFWTKNPAPLMEYLDEIDERGYDYYFHFTLNPYGDEIEPGLGDKNKLLDAFISLSERIGAERVIWRYDPILINAFYTAAWHEEQFRLMSGTLKGATRQCYVSFIDIYRKIEKDMERISVPHKRRDEKLTFLTPFAKMAKARGMKIKSCATEEDLSSVGIEHGSCIDGELIESLLGRKVTRARDGGQRKHCACIKSRDIGSYATCRYSCLYCYAR